MKLNHFICPHCGHLRHSLRYVRRRKMSVPEDFLQQINIEAADDIVDLRKEENQIRAASDRRAAGVRAGCERRPRVWIS
jgi:hypothetical protein